MKIVSIYPAPFDIQLRHEANSAILYNNKIYAYEEGKITSVKNEPTTLFPEKSLMLGFKELKIIPENVDLWVFPKTQEKLDLKGLYLFFSFFLKAYKGNRKNFKNWVKKKIKIVKHHDLHTYSSIGCSGYKSGSYVNFDGGGDFGDTRNCSWGTFNNRKIKEYGKSFGLNNIACFHAFITDLCGFKTDNGKVTGIAAYGKINDNLKEKFLKVLKINNNQIIFTRKRYKNSKPNLNNLDVNEYDRYKILNPFPAHSNISEICKGFNLQDIAATAENIIEEFIIKFLKNIKKKYKKEYLENIVFSGGLFLNVNLNAKIEKSKLFKRCFFPPAPSDSGLALGGVFSQKLIKIKNSKYGISPLLGPSFKNLEIEKNLKKFKLHYIKCKSIHKDIAANISKGKIVGIFNGKAEYGQRSLGSRSILADPRKKDSKHRLNINLKRRDWFMPFAPAILDNHFFRWFGNDQRPSLYMQKALRVLKDKKKFIPSAVHIDDTCRVQYVSKDKYPNFWKIINEFYKLTKIPLILNTSFNRHGISTISTPRQAIEHLMEGCIEILYINEFKVELKKNRKIKFSISKKITEKNLLKQENINWKKKLKKY